jgi:NAD(P)-dependent dehydrogenase (short-subunit alcohol dehydrogenase family)
MTDLTDRVAIVTGAGGNLGQAVAQRLQAAGARLVLAERDADKVRALFPPGDRVLIVPADLTDPASVAGLVEQAMARFGQIDILANTVGGYRAGTPAHETPVETWDFMLTLNARTAFLISQAVVPPMLARGQGKIVHVAARGGLEGSAKHAAYSASKSALIRLTESMAAELKHSGINVNCVLPGTIDTPQNREAMPKADYSKWVAPDTIADVMMFLASDAARAVHGAAIPVYGQS